MNRVEERIEADTVTEGFDLRSCAGAATGFLLFFAANTVYMRLVVAPLGSGGASSNPAAVVFYLTGVALGLIIGFLAARRRANLGGWVAPAGSVAFVLGAVVELLSCGGVLPAAWDSVSACVVAAADTLLLLAWGRVLGARSPKESLFCAAVGYVFGSCLAILCVSFAPAGAMLAVAAVCAVVSGRLAAVGSRGSVEPGALSPADRPVDAPVSASDSAPAGSPLLRDALGFLWKPVVAALLCAFITGSANADGSGMSAGSAAYVSLGTTLIGLVLVAAICVPKRTFNLRRFYQIFIPIAAIVLLCVPFLDSESASGWSMLVRVVNSCGFTLLDITTISALATCVFILSVPSDLVFSLERSLGAVVMLLGSCVQPLLGEEGMRTLCAVVLAVFLASVVVSLVRTDGAVAAPARPAAEPAGGSSSRPASRSVSQPAEKLSEQACCQALSEHGGLSPRESQVLAYLVRGRGSTFIGQELCISVQTVKTHTKHIYEKLDVHSREDLLTLVERVRSGELG